MNFKFIFLTLCSTIVLQVISYYDYNQQQWFYTSQARVVCVRNRDLELDEEMADEADDGGEDPGKVPKGNPPNANLPAGFN